MRNYFIVFLLGGLVTLAYGQNPCTTCDFLPVLEKYDEGNDSNFKSHQRSIAALSRYVSASPDITAGDYTLRMLIDEQGGPTIQSIDYNGQPITDKQSSDIIHQRAEKYHGLNKWLPAQEELEKKATVITVAFDVLDVNCPDGLYDIRQLIEASACNEYFCSKSDFITFLDYYDEDLDSWNYLAESEKNSLSIKITYPTKKESVTVEIEQVPTEEQWEQLKKKLPKKGKIEIERSIASSETRYIAVTFE